VDSDSTRQISKIIIFPFFPLLSTQADVILLVTCSIREKAEQTIWNRLHQLKALKTKRLRSRVPLRIGILGIR
uniref:MTTase N-terminal domain-containing protein n=1 Tax=Mustela putorius furo TaxID=9669 RepID=M3Z2B2_MUSPF